MKRNEYLDEKGFLLKAVFNISDLPDQVYHLLQGSVARLDEYKQLILLAHAGRTMWQQLQNADIVSDNPVDDYSVSVVHDYFRQYMPTNKYEIIYPGDAVIGLQKLGELAGWHHDSPFRIGVHKTWGSWFAYRAVVLADCRIELTEKDETESPCDSCHSKPCVTACPPAACDEDNMNFSLQKCIDFRKQPASACRLKCLARLACPVGEAYRYTDEQIAYHYGVSLKTIETYY